MIRTFVATVLGVAAVRLVFALFELDAWIDRVAAGIQGAA